jgi:hypothetical protein
VVPAVALGLLAVCGAGGGDEKPAPAPAGRPVRDVQRAPLLGKVPPELRAAKEDWLAGPPTTFAALKGKAVWLQFNF